MRIANKNFSVKKFPRIHKGVFKIQCVMMLSTVATQYNIKLKSFPKVWPYATFTI